MKSFPFIRNNGVVVLAIVLTFCLKALVEAWMGVGPPLLVYLPVVTIGAWLGGMTTGLVAVALVSLICIYVHFEPYHTFRLHNSNDQLRLMLFVCEGVLVSACMEMLHAARRRSESSIREARRYHEALGRSEGRLRAILDNSPSVIYLKDESGRYLLANRRFEVLTRLSSEQLVGLIDEEIFPAEAAAQYRATDRKVVEQGRAIESEDTLVHADGPHTYLSTKFPLCGSDGSVYAVGGIATDITERKRVVWALEASEQRFRALCQSSPVGIFLTDGEGQTTYTNPRCQEIYGFLPEEGLGDGWTRFIHPDDRDRVRDQWERLAPIGQAFAMEYRLPGPDGSVRWVFDRTAPLLSERGDVMGHVGTVEDVTERHRAEDAVRRQRDFAEGLIATAQAIVLVLDRQGRIVRVNPFLGRVTGRCPDQARGEDWFSAFVPPRDRRRARDAFLRALSGEGGEHITYPILTRDHHRRQVEWANRTLEGPGGEAWLLAIGHDITALEEAQARALQAERLAGIGEMVAGLSHESRNALHRSQVCLEMLAIEVEDRPEALSLIARTQAAQDDLYRLFDDVRTYASPIILDLRACDVATVWREAWAQLEGARRGRDDALREQLDGLDPHCAADPFRLGQVFRNVLDNALAASAEAANIEIRCGGAELDGQPALRIAVHDRGPGLSPEQRQRIFEPFFTTKTRGTGLGMAISRRIVDAHGGQITIGEGGEPGAEIIITLPKRIAMNSTLRIAVADDELDVRDYYQRILPRLGHQVVAVAQNGRELVTCAAASDPDLVITDIKMPDMDGIEAAQAISEEDPIPVISVSAYHRPQLFERASGDHILAYLVKPTKQADLEAAIAIVMRRFGQFQTLRKESADKSQALEDRKVIERAKGLLMKRAVLDEEEAFRRLRKLARDRNQKLVDIARLILTADDLLQPAVG